jgi:VIT1/CCC1 family predicted Fe2+/Mn2+ transporter
MNSPRVAKRLPSGGIPIVIPGVDHRMQADFQSALQGYVRACGCGAGAGAFVGSLVMLTAYVFAVTPESWQRLGSTVAVGFVAAIILTAAAKFAALRFARTRFENSCARLLRSLEN